MDIFDGVALYKKDKHSDLSRAAKKSKHKHHYKMFLMEYPFQNPFTGKIDYRHNVVTYCIICGKVGNVGLFSTIPLPDGRSRLLTDDEIVNIHSDLPLVRTETCWVDYIDLSMIHVNCKDCRYLMFSDCYGECGKAYKGIVNPEDTCPYGERKE